MQQLIFDEPYEFIPPHRGSWLPRLLRLAIPWNLRKDHGVVEIQCRGIGLLKSSLQAGHGIILAPNHCRPCDPLVLNQLAVDVRTLLFAMASWHVFKQTRWMRYIVRAMGAFSVHREGVDRAAINCSVEILVRAQRPLVIFPEGMISRTNDRLGALMEGISLIARSAAKKRLKKDAAARVVVHPVAMKYQFLGDLETTVAPTLVAIERRLSWRPQSDLPMYERIAKLGTALLGLKEMEHLDTVHEGLPHDRARRLIEHLLDPPEEEWSQGRRNGSVVQRVKKLRSAILKDMVHGDLPESEHDRRWRIFEDLDLAQLLSLYPEGYLSADATRERFLETIERFEEDLTGDAGPHPPIRAIVQVCDAIEVDPERDRKATEDPLMEAIDHSLRASLADLYQEVSPTQRPAADNG